MTALNGILSFYPGYPAVVETNWNKPGVDGCIDPSNVPTCTALVLADLSPNCSLGSCVHFAVATATERDPGNSYVFSSPDGRIDLAPLPSVRSPGMDDSDVEFNHIDLTVPRPAGSSDYLDPACEEPLAGYRVHVREKINEAPPPLTRQDWPLAPGGGTGPGGAPIPFGTSTRVAFGCDERLAYHSRGMLVAYSVVFEDGFELPWVKRLTPSDAVDASRDGALYCCVDLDADGYCVDDIRFPIDCDDHDPTVLPGGEQVCGDLKNNARQRLRLPRARRERLRRRSAGYR